MEGQASFNYIKTLGAISDQEQLIDLAYQAMPQ